MHRDPRIPFRRSQIYAVLNGNLVQVPSWDFVRAFVLACQQYAERNQRHLPTSTDLAIWRRDHAHIVELAAERGRQNVTEAAGPSDRSVVVPRQEVRIYDVVGAPPCRISTVSGDIRRVTSFDAWVNPENTDMAMARVTDHSISAVIRYEGAEHDPAGHITNDLIADDLRRATRGRQPVAPATVVPTDAGRLRETHGVHRIFHVAAVHGEPGAGYHPVAEIDRCLVAVARAAADDERIESILVPLFGVGTARGELDSTVATLIEAAIGILAHGPIGPL